MNNTIVIAIGGNAICKEGQKGTFEEQMSNLNNSMAYIADLAEQGYRIVLVHGNGPQVGNVLIQNEMAKQQVPASRLDVCVADTQGQIGHMMMLSLRNCLKQRGIDKNIVTMLTQVEVSPDDPAFNAPTKPIGPFFTAEQAEALRSPDYVIVEDSGRGYRRVVPSPKPVCILEKDAIEQLSQNAIVIAVGGGGIPVYTQGETLCGIEAVIDKDYASALLAEEIGADLVILTGVEQVSINFGKPNQQAIASMTVTEAQAFMAQGHFPKGSMGPKIDAALNYLAKGGKRVVITSMQSLKPALAGLTGTIITT